jgi:hypothetical protein
MRTVRILISLSMCLSTLLLGYAQTYRLRDNMIQTNGTVHAVKRANGNVYLGGDFSTVEYSTGHGAILNVSSGEPDVPFPLANQEITAVASDGQGGWYIGGKFTQIDGQNRNGLAHIRANKTLNPSWIPNVNSGATPDIRAIAYIDGKVFIGGVFNNVDGQNISNLAALNSFDGKLIEGWNPQVGGPVNTFTTRGDVLFAGGEFTTVGGGNRNRAAAWNTIDGSLLPWDPNFGATVFTLKYNDIIDAVFAGGEFLQVKGAANYFRVALIDLDGNPVPTWNPQINGGPVRTIGILGNTPESLRIFVGGDFTSAGGRFNNPYLTEFTTENNAATEFSANINAPVNALVATPNAIIFGGFFQNVNETVRNRIAALNPQTAELLNWDPNANNIVNVIEQFGDRLYVGGRFTTIGRLTRRNLFAYNESSGLILRDFEPALNGTVRAIEAAGSVIYVGGDFTQIDNTIRRYVAAISVLSNNVQSWNPDSDGPVRAIKFFNNTIYVGGNFTRVGAADRNNIAALSTSSFATSWNPGTNGPVNALAAFGNYIYAGGQFTEAGDRPINITNLIAIRANATANYVDVNWVCNPTAGGQVRALSIDETKRLLYIGGSFISVQGADNFQFARAGENARNLVAVQLARPTATATYPIWYESFFPQPDDTVHAVVAPNNQRFVYAGGSFGSIGGASSTGPLIQLDDSTGLASTWRPNVALPAARPFVYALDQFNLSLFVGGRFNQILSQRSVNFGELTVCTAVADITSSRNSICPNESVNLTGVAGGFGNFSLIWSPAESLSSTVGTNVTARPSQTTTYTLFVTDGQGCGASAQYTVTLNQPTPLTVSSNKANNLVCLNDTIDLTIRGGIAYSWNAPNAPAFSSEATVRVRPTVNTTYTINGITPQGCPATTGITVFLLPLPTISAGPNVSTCLNRDSVQLFARLTGNTGVDTFSWTPTAGLSNAKIANPLVLVTNTTDYIVTAKTTLGCTARDTIRITVGAAPTATAAIFEDDVEVGKSITTCPGDTVDIRGVTDGRTVGWEPRAFISNATTANTFVRPQVTTTYTYTSRNEFCTSVDSVTIEVKEVEVPDAGVDRFICRGSAPVQLNASGTGTVSWSPNDAGLSSIDINNPLASPVVSTTYTVTFTDASSTPTCSASDTVRIIVFDRPFIDAGPNQLICNGEAVAVSATPGFVSYRWTPTTGLINPNGSDPIANPSQTTTYTVLGVDENGCEANDEVTVVVSRRPNASAGADVNICRGSSATLGASGGTRYNWIPSEGLSATDVSNPVANPTVSTAYTVVVTNDDNCSASDVVIVNVLDIPMADAGIDQAICKNPTETTILNASGGISYRWLPQAGLSNPLISNPIARPMATTMYTVTVIGANGCRAIDSVMVAILPEPNGRATFDTIPTCPGQQVRIHAEGGFTYEWNPRMFIIDSASAFMASPLVAIMADTFFTVKIFDEEGCYKMDTVVMRIRESVMAEAGPDIEICPNSFGTLMPTTTDGALFRWEPTLGLDNPNIREPKASPAESTTFTLFVTGPGTDGCVTMDTVRVIVFPTTMINTGNDTVICAGRSVQLFAANGNRYSWSPEAGLDNPNIPRPTARPTESTVYTVTATDSNGCIATNTQRVTIFNPPAIPIFPETDTLHVFCRGEGTIKLSTNPVPGYMYQWIRDGEAISDANGAAYTANVGGSYVIEVTVNSCPVRSMERFVVVQPKPTITINPGQPAVCRGDSVQLRAEGGHVYRWQPIQLVTNANISDPFAKPMINTTFTVLALDTNTMCSSSATVLVTVNEVAAVSVAPRSVPSICEGQVVELVATSGPGYSYQWFRNDVRLPEGRFNVFPASNEGEYSVQVSINGCTSQRTIPIRVDVFPYPVANAGEDRLICAQGLTMLEGSGGAAYVWNPPVGLSDPFLASTIARPSRTVTYTLTVVGQGGCSSTDSVTVFVTDANSLPRPTISSSKAPSICPGDSVTLVAQMPSFGNIVNYQWHLNGEAIDDAERASFVARTPGIYTVMASFPSCSSSVSNSITVTERPAPGIGLTVVKRASCPTCNDGIVEARARGGLPPYRFSYDGVNFYDSRRIIGLRPGGYRIFVRDSAGCIGSDSIFVGSVPTSNVQTAVSSSELSTSVYPNPSTGLFHFKVENLKDRNIQVQVYDLMGKQVYQHQYTASSSSFTAHIDLSAHVSGIYFLKVKSKEIDLTKKIVKQ